MQRILFDLQSSQAAQVARTPFGWILFTPGAALVLLGLVIWAVPQLLVALVASTCIALGTLMLLVAWRLRRSVRP